MVQAIRKLLKRCQKKMKKKKKLVWWPVLEVLHCKKIVEFPKLILTLVILPLQQYKCQDYSGFPTQAKNRS